MQSLDRINFPVFKLRQFNKLTTIDGITRVETHWKTYILDNKNLLGETLGERRLRIKEGIIYPFKTTYKTPRDLVLNSNTGDVYTDNKGNIFKYQKTKKCDVKCYKIQEIKRLESKVVLHLFRFPVPIVVPKNTYSSDIKYVTIVKYGDYFLLYSLEQEYVQPFKKKL